MQNNLRLLLSTYIAHASGGSVHRGAFATRLADGLQLELLFGIVLVSVDYCCELSMGSSFVTCSQSQSSRFSHVLQILDGTSASAPSLLPLPANRTRACTQADVAGALLGRFRGRISRSALVSLVIAQRLPGAPGPGPNPGQQSVRLLLQYRVLRGSSAQAPTPARDPRYTYC